MRTTVHRIAILATMIALVTFAGLPAAAAGQQSPLDQEARLDKVASRLDLVEERLDRLERNIDRSELVDPSPPRLFAEEVEWVLGAIENATSPLHGLHWRVVEASLDRASDLRQRALALEDRLDAWSFVSHNEPDEVPLITYAGLGTGSISGILTGNATGDPIAFTRVEIYCSDPYFDAETMSDGAGHYVMTGLEAGTCYARTRNSLGYIDELWDDIPCHGYCWMDDGTPIIVVDGAETSGIDFALELAGGIRGTVTDEATGDPLADGSVHLYDDNGDYAGSAGSDGQGIYRFNQLMPGIYYAQVYNQDYFDELYDDIPCEDGCDPTTGTPITVTSGTLTSGIDFPLQLGGSISGTIIDEATSNPLSGARVYVYDVDGDYLKSRYTSANGAFVIGDLTTGTYFVKVRKSGFLTELYDDIACDGCDPTTGTPIAVTAGLDTPNIDVALGRGSTLSGRVTSASSGAPLVNSEATRYDDTGLYEGQTYSNSNGEYSFSVLYPGSYHVIAEEDFHIDELYDDIPCQPSCDPTTGTPIAVPEDTDVGGIDFALDLGGAIHGTVVSALTGAPLPNGRVHIYDGAGTQVATSYVDDVGTYSTHDLVAGTYFAVADDGDEHLPQLFDGLPCGGGCDPTAGTPVGVSLGAVTEDIDFSLTGGFISGHVTDASTGTPLYANVDVYNDTGAFICDSNMAAEGSFRSCALQDGTYFISAGRSDYVRELYDDIPCDDGCDPATGSPVGVTVGATTENIDFALTPHGSISGKVTDDSTGMGVPDLRVEIYDSIGDYVDFPYTDNGGFYSTDSLEAGTYFVVASSSSYDSYAAELYNNIPCDDGCDPTTGTPITVVDANITENIDFTLVPYGSISGRATDATSGEPIGYVEVNIYDSSGNHINYTNTDNTGYYSTGGLRAGTYFAVAGGGSWDDYAGELYDDIPCDDGCDPTTGTPITVVDATTTENVDFVLEPYGSISGRVTDIAGGPPQDQIVVLVYDANGYQVDSTYTDGFGYYLIRYIRSGPYFVVTGNGSNNRYAGELYDDIPCDSGCDPTTGTPVVVTNGTVTENVDFVLIRHGRISGRVIDALSGGPPSHGDLDVRVFDASGVWADTANIGPGGYYSTDGLTPGAYFVVTESDWNDGYVDELYDDIPCDDGCDPTTGTPVIVTNATITPNIDFELMPYGSVTGRITDSLTGGDPWRGFLEVSIYDSGGSQVASINADNAGYYASNPVPPGSYFVVAKDRYSWEDRYVDELYDNIPCNDGCSVLTGTPVEVTNASITTDIDFALEPIPTFADVPLDFWAFEWIETVYDAEVTAGCAVDPLRYCPDDVASRAQMAVFLLASKEGQYYNPPDAIGIFDDVPADDPFARWIEELATRGITSGCSVDPPLYCPNNPVTRDQMAIFLLATLEGALYEPPLCTGVFADVPCPGGFAVDWIEALAARGITAGCGGGNYCPQNPVTRAEMAVFLVKTFSLP